MASFSSNVALVGKHSEVFKSELKKAGFTPVEFKSANQVLEDTDSYQAIAISGSEHGLTEKAFISQLLDAGKVLVAFEPGADYLHALHAATHTPIDLTAVKPTADRPLMVHKEDGDLILTCTPKVKTDFQVQVPDGKFQTNTAIRSSLEPHTQDVVNVEEITNEPAQVVERIKRAVRAVREGPEEKRAAVGEVHELDPGRDVAFYKKVQVRISTDYSIDTQLPDPGDFNPALVRYDKSQSQVYHTDWRMTIYVYATDASPLGQTTDSYKGTIYTYVVHDGIHGRKSGSNERVNVVYSEDNIDFAQEYYFVDIMGYSFRDTGGVLSKITQQPDDNIYEHRDDTFNYNIAQEQRMLLFTAHENQTWNFNASYQKPCAWNRFQMHHDISNWDDAGYVISYNDLYDVWTDPNFNKDNWHDPGVFRQNNGKLETLPDDNIPISGLTVFSSKVGKAPLHLELDYIPRAFLLDNYQKTPLHIAYAASVIGLYVDDFVLDLTWNE
ncbi:hypothetical protein SCHPADRAFT_1000431 [Schizopora paradoxa]|uniref:Uncharacterized protein n=1 Tax=Schizopora paradoxa TaxID=27342 RepID=A0A0H2RCD4_9AGAM|nr:hypothetical protein SCHPADRAFT_1000431 [Schizopora paradoxa]